MGAGILFKSNIRSKQRRDTGPRSVECKGFWGLKGFVAGNYCFICRQEKSFSSVHATLKQGGIQVPHPSPHLFLDTTFRISDLQPRLQTGQNSLVL